MAKAKEIEELDCEGNAAVGIGLVLCGRLEEMCGLRAGALDWSDAEGVHDMRVASRRLRSALRDFKPYLRRRRKLASAVKELKRVADALGAVRDDDVAIMALEELQREAMAEVTKGIAILMDERRGQRDAARASLVKAIKEERLAGLQSEFAVAIESATEPRRHHAKKKSAAAALSFRAAGREIILARLEELRELSACLYMPFEVAGLHSMRIAAKRLRYAMELFASCWGEALNENGKEVAELQTSLGELHDCDVWLEGFGQTLRDFQRRVDENGSPLNEAEQQKRGAIVWLMRHFARARMKHFGNALTRWHEWETNGFFTQLVNSLDARPPAVELSPVTLTAAQAVAADIKGRESS